jgi:hypothetical protein
VLSGGVFRVFAETLLSVESQGIGLERIMLSFFGYDLLGLIGLIIIGLIIILLIRLLLVLIPAVLVAVVVWFLTGSLWWAGVAFLVVAALSVLKKLF